MDERVSSTTTATPQTAKGRPTEPDRRHLKAGGPVIEGQIKDPDARPN